MSDEASTIEMFLKWFGENLDAIIVWASSSRGNAILAVLGLSIAIAGIVNAGVRFIIARVKAKKIDWDDFGVGFSRISSRPNGGLLDYLSPETLPYYGLKSFSDDFPFLGEGTLFDEYTLLQKVMTSDSPLIIMGKGGSGKTRMGLEICRLLKTTKEFKAVAMSVSNSIVEGDLKTLQQYCKQANQTVLLLVDNIERLNGSVSFDRICEYSNSSLGRIKILATTRQTYLENYQSLPEIVKNDRCELINLSDGNSDDLSIWLNEWRIQVGRLILNTTEDVQTPGLAIILAHLRKKYPDAKTWVPNQEAEWVFDILYNSVKNKFPNLDVTTHDLLSLLVCFEIDPKALDAILQNDSYSSILESWIADGWVIKVSNANSTKYILGHDILCDLPLFHNFQRNRVGFKSSIHGLWLKSRELNSQRSFFLALERIISELSESQNICKILFPLEISKFSKPKALTASRTQIRSLIQGAISSLSLDPTQKVMVISQAQELSKFQVQELDKVFKEESEKFKKLAEEHPEDIVKLVRNAFSRSPLLLEMFLHSSFLHSEQLYNLRKELSEELALRSPLEHVKLIIRLKDSQLANVIEAGKEFDENHELFELYISVLLEICVNTIQIPELTQAVSGLEFLSTKAEGYVESYRAKYFICRCLSQGPVTDLVVQKYREFLNYSGPWKNADLDTRLMRAEISLYLGDALTVRGDYKSAFNVIMNCWAILEYIPDFRYIEMVFKTLSRAVYIKEKIGSYSESLEFSSLIITEYEEALKLSKFKSHPHDFFDRNSLFYKAAILCNIEMLIALGRSNCALEFGNNKISSMAPTDNLYFLYQFLLWLAGSSKVSIIKLVKSCPETYMTGWSSKAILSNSKLSEIHAMDVLKSTISFFEGDASRTDTLKKLQKYTG